MFNYIFPIFCFGVVISGIVLLGLMQAAAQLKAESATKAASPRGDRRSEVTSTRKTNPSRSAVPNTDE